MEGTNTRVTRTQRRHTTPIFRTGKLTKFFTNTTSHLIILTALATTQQNFKRFITMDMDTTSTMAHMATTIIQSIPHKVKEAAKVAAPTAALRVQ